MARQYRSTVEAKTLSTGINSSVTSMTLNSITTLPTSYPYTLVIDPDTATEEIVSVTALASGTTLTIARGQDNTSPQSHNAAAVVKHMITARDLQEPHDHIDATAVHGATGAVVGTTNTQTLTNKTLTSPTITGAVITSANIVDGAIVNADINASAAIDWTKLAVSSTVSATELGYVDGVTSAIQTQLDGKVTTPGAWTSYTPVWSATTTNPVLNNGTITGAYNQIGKTVNFRILMTIGSSTTFGTGNYRWTLPVTGAVSGVAVANGFIYDASTTNYFPVNAARASTTQITEVFYTTNLSGNVNSVLPITWATSDVICFNGTYEAA